MAAIAGSVTGTIRLNLVDGGRAPFPENVSMLVRVLDGSKKQVAWQVVKGATVLIPQLPFHDNLDDLYTVIVHADGYEDAGVYPVRVRAGHLVDAYLMLLPRGGRFHFSPWSGIPGSAVHSLLTNGATGDPAARYNSTMEAHPAELGALLTIGTAIAGIPLVGGGSPFDCYWEVIWDLPMPDRFWAWVDAGLAQRIADLAAVHSVAEEADAAHWHPGVPGRVAPATRSWKEIRFDMANVQLTFHESDRKTVPLGGGQSVQCVIVEPDIDYYKDLLSHGLGEVLPNLLTGNKTDPRMDYLLRWMDMHQEGLGEFSPPCTIE